MGAIGIKEPGNGGTSSVVLSIFAVVEKNKGNTFLQRTITVDVTLAYIYDPKSKQRKHIDLPPPLFPRRHKQKRPACAEQLGNT